MPFEQAIKGCPEIYLKIFWSLQTKMSRVPLILWFFIGYWINTGRDFHHGPFFCPKVPNRVKTPLNIEQGTRNTEFRRFEYFNILRIKFD